VIGMMIIGIGLYREETGAISIPFLCYNLVHKFLIMPCLFFMLFFVSSTLISSIQPFASVYYLISIVPLAAGSISLAIEFKHDIYNVAMSVLISTLVALPIIYIVHLFL
jgi:predicted permease